MATWSRQPPQLTTRRDRTTRRVNTLEAIIVFILFFVVITFRARDFYVAVRTYGYIKYHIGTKRSK